MAYITSKTYPINGKDLGPDIRDLVYRYVKIPSFTFSKGERLVEPFFLDYFSQLPYFKEHPEYVGTYPLKDDPFDRSVCYALIRKEGDEHKEKVEEGEAKSFKPLENKTVVLIHHYDVVSLEDYKTLCDEAFEIDALEAALLKIKESLSRETREDLESGDYIFGHGACDMKAGGAIQMALMKAYSQCPEQFAGNLLLLAVPDEENQSAGMRAAVNLMEKFMDSYGFSYEMMINSEPHQRKTKAVSVLSEGSVGKLMPFVYVRGSLSHAGKVFEGLNPLGIMSSIVTKTEMSMSFSETVGKEASPPPTWLYLKDSKCHYDVSMPQSIYGSFSVLTLNQTPGKVMNKLRTICEEAFSETLHTMNSSYTMFLQQRQEEDKSLPWVAKVVSFTELFDEAKIHGGEVFIQAYEKKLSDLKSLILKGQADYISGNLELIETLYDFVEDLSPRVVYGLIPPYYPNVSNLFFPYGSAQNKNISHILSDFAKIKLMAEYEIEYFFTGISDLSYTSIYDSKQIRSELQENMPLFGRLYDLPLDAIEKISMPCLNIGPWGKDFHKMTERVLKDDLFRVTPALLDYAIKQLLSF